MIPWGFVFLAAAAVGRVVNYSDPVCAVKGSTVTLLCTFTPLQSIVRVRWCQNHEICQRETPSVYDSDSQNNTSRYKYLGNKTGNCTLQISDIQKTDGAIHRFRMEAEDVSGHFTERSGVKVTVTEFMSDPMRIESSTPDPGRGQTITLRCTATCTFHQLEVTWLKDGRLIPGSGPALKLGPLTAEHSGNYTCGLRTNAGPRSLPYDVHVEAEEEASVGSDPSLVIGVVFCVLLALVTLTVVVCIIRRKWAADKRQTASGGQVPKRPDDIYSYIPPPAAPGAGHRPLETSGALEDINYVSVQFKHQNQIRPVVRSEHAVIYSSVANHG